MCSVRRDDSSLPTRHSLVVAYATCFLLGTWMYPAARGGGCEEKITLFSDAARRSWQDARSFAFKTVFDLLLLRSEHHHHLPPFHERVLLDRRVRRQIVLHPAQQFPADFLVRHFTAAEPHGYLGLVAFLQEADQVAHLHLIVAL